MAFPLHNIYLDSCDVFVLNAAIWILISFRMEKVNATNCSYWQEAMAKRNFVISLAITFIECPSSESVIASKVSQTRFTWFGMRGL